MGIIEPRESELKTGEKILVRSVALGEAASLLSFISEVFADPAFFITQAHEKQLTEAQEEEWIAQHTENPFQVLLSAESTGSLVGLLNLDADDRKRVAHWGTLHMSVLKEWRGKGVGTALINALMEWAGENPQLEKLCLSVFANNDRAIRLYEKMGFVEEGRRKKQFKLGPDEYVDEVLMSRFVK